MKPQYTTTTRNYYNISLDGRKIGTAHLTMEKASNAAKKILNAGFNSVEIHKTVSTDEKSHIYQVDIENGSYLRMVQ